MKKTPSYWIQWAYHTVPLAWVFGLLAAGAVLLRCVSWQRTVLYLFLLFLGACLGHLFWHYCP